MTRRSLFSAVILAFLVTGIAAGGEEKGKKGAKPPMDEKAMMEAWQKFATPGEEHKKLDGMVGTWDTKVVTWMAPGAPAQESSGTSENRWVLGNRFIEQRFEGTFMSQPFSGLGYTGYDNYKKKYVASWMDTAGTSIMMSEGSADPGGKTMTFWATMDDFMTGKKMKIKEVVTTVDPDHIVFEMWAPAPDGKPYKNMEIHYTRKK